MKPVCDRISGSNDLEILLDLGEVPIGGVYWRDPEESVLVQAPLRLAVSHGSGLVQLADAYEASLYEQYTFSGASSASYNEHVRAVAKSYLHDLPSSARVFEIGASDGVLLSELQAAGCTVMGMEPSGALVERAQSLGLSVEQGYVDAESASIIVDRHGQMQAVVMRHVLEHLDDPSEMFDAINCLAAQDGLLFLELPDLAGIIEQRSYSSIFHEHVAYYSAPVLWQLLADHGWGVCRYCTQPVHGQSHQLVARRGAHQVVAPSSGVNDADIRAFVDDFSQYLTAFRRLVADELEAGKRLGVYGCSHRTPGLLAHGDLLNAPLYAAFDSNKLLQGLCLPPSAVRIAAPDQVSRDVVDTVLIAALSYEDEIIEQLRPFADAGGRLICLGGGEPRVL